MVSTLKENPNGGFYCSECRMSTSEPVETCPFCGSVISNWMDIIIEQENNRIRAMYDIDPITGKNRFVKDDQQSDVSPTDDWSLLDKERIKQLLKVMENEDNIHGRN